MSIGHFGTSAEMSWVRSVLVPKCPYTPGSLGEVGSICVNPFIKRKPDIANQTVAKQHFRFGGILYI